MKMIHKIVAFILTFCLLACTVTVMSTADFSGAVKAAAVTVEPTETTAPTEGQLAATGAEATYKPRLTAPAYSNKYYYSDANIFYKYGYGMPNCTCYAWGRAYELLKTAPKLCIYGADRWYDYNLTYGYYPCGQEPKVGAIACWCYTYGSGHVAVVEKVENGKITFSNSAYGGDEFYLTTAPVNDPSGGRSSWIFQGYIYIGDFGSAAETPTEAEEPTEAVEGDVYRIDTLGGVNFRSGAGTSYSSLGIIPNGKELTVTKTKKADGYLWGYTTYNGKNGWFATDYAKLIKKADQNPTEAPTVAPTQTPTEAPTQAPTEKPTQAPTAAPTQAPTQSSTEFVYAPRPDTYLVPGDLDSDGIVTIMDATRIQLILADLYVPTKYMLYIGDYDQDGVFTIIDASRIRHDLAYGLI